MGALMVLGSIFVFFVSINDHENSEPYADTELIQLGFAALLLLCGTAIYLRRGDG